MSKEQIIVKLVEGMKNGNLYLTEEGKEFLKNLLNVHENILVK